MLGGVSAGLAKHFDLDPALVRVAFAVTALFSGAGLIAYLVLWAMVPRDGDEPAAVKTWPAAA
jgi:phage shock protein PspC (stress-responsive transcriptional regulator)